MIWRDIDGLGFEWEISGSKIYHVIEIIIQKSVNKLFNNTFNMLFCKLILLNYLLYIQK